jgi:outer membrane protein assembly factor BamB
MRCLSATPRLSPPASLSLASRAYAIMKPLLLLRAMFGSACLAWLPLFLISHSAWGADWPQWGGSEKRNMASSEQGLPARFDPGKKQRTRLGFDLNTAKNVKWCVRLGTENYSSPTIANGRVFIGTNDETLDDPRYRPTRGGLFLALEEKTGDLLWQLVVPRLEIDRSKVSEDFDDMNLGICSTATVDGDRVYLVSNRCEVLCLDVHGLQNGNDGPFQDEATFSVAEGSAPVELTSRDADILWRFDMLRDLPVFPHDATNCSVLVHGDYIYVGTGNGVYDGKVVLPTAPTLIALNKHTGQLAARDDSGISANVLHGQWSSPSLTEVAGRPLFFYGGGDGKCYAFEPLAAGITLPAKLKEVWRFDGNPAGYREREGKPIDYWALVRGGTQDSNSDGQLLSPNEIISSPVVYDNKIYFTIGQDPLHGRGRGALSCVDPAAGEGDITKTGCVWQYKDIGRSMSTVSVAGGLVYAAETFGKVHCLDAKTGELYWVHDTRDDIWSSTFVADGKVYLGTRRGLVVLAAGKQKKHLADIKLGTQVFSVPSAANGVLYVASQQNLWAIEDQGEMPSP